MHSQQIQYEEYFKIIVVGNSGAGKTSITQMYEKGAKPNHVLPTVGVDYCSKVVQLSPKKSVKLQIWDTAGQQRYRSVAKNHYKNAAGALIIYDITDKKSFTEVVRWIEDIRQRCKQNVIIGLVANKVDCQNRKVVTRQQGQNLASRHNLFYVQTSIMDPNSIKRAFERMAQQIELSGNARNLEFSRTNVELKNNFSKKQDGCQC